MPGVSQKYPPANRNSLFPLVRALGRLQGFAVNPDTGDVTGNAIIQHVDGVAAFIWDALGYLDIIDQQQIAQDAQIAALREGIAELKMLLGPVVQIAQSLGVDIPDWRTRDDVEKGRPDMVDVLSAEEAGLRVTFNVVQEFGVDERAIIRIEPPIGTFVARGSEVVVTVNDG